MTLGFRPLLPGEDLMDVETFYALHATHTALPVRPTDLGGVEFARVSDPVRARSEAEPSEDRKGKRGGAAAGRARSEAEPSEDHKGKRLHPEGPNREMPRPPSSPAAAAALEAEIDRCTSRDHLVRLAVHLTRAYAPATALFLVHRGTIEALPVLGPAVGGAEILLPADAPSLFAAVVASGEPFRGAPPQDGLDGRLLRSLGRGQVREIVVLPVAVRGRVVSLLYADNGPEALGDASVAALLAVCARLSRAYERLILERKVGEARLAAAPR